MLEQNKKMMVENQIYNSQINYLDQQIEDLDGKSKTSFVKMKFINLDLNQKLMDRFWYE